MSNKPRANRNYANQPPQKPALRGPASDGTFYWKGVDGEEFSLPSISTIGQNMTMDDIAQFAERSASNNAIIRMAAQISFIQADITPEARAAIGKFHPDQFLTMMRAWSAHSGIGLGESSAS